jgi:hypothetical protein
MWEDFFLIAQSDKKGKNRKEEKTKDLIGPFVMSGQIVHRPLNGKVGRFS